MVVVTPTYAPDLDLFSDLHGSVLRWFPSDVRHVVVVTEPDLAPFRQFEGPDASSSASVTFYPDLCEPYLSASCG